MEMVQMGPVLMKVGFSDVVCEFILALNIMENLNIKAMFAQPSFVRKGGVFDDSFEYEIQFASFYNFHSTFLIKKTVFFENRRANNKKSFLWAHCRIV